MIRSKRTKFIDNRQVKTYVGDVFFKSRLEQKGLSEIKGAGWSSRDEIPHFHLKCGKTTLNQWQSRQVADMQTHFFDIRRVVNALSNRSIAKGDNTRAPF